MKFFHTCELCRTHRKDYNMVTFPIFTGRGRPPKSSVYYHRYGRQLNRTTPLMSRNQAGELLYSQPGGIRIHSVDGHVIPNLHPNSNIHGRTARQLLLSLPAGSGLKVFSKKCKETFIETFENI